MSSPEVLRDLVDDSIESKVFSAAACALVTPTGAKVKIVRGLSDPDRNEQATSTSLFDLASLTKPIATGSLLVKALELGLISLAEKATKWIPDAQYLKDVTVSHLIGHVSGLPSWKALYQTPDKSAIEQIAATPLKRPSGTEYEYSDLGYILLGEILAQVYGQSLDEAAKKYIFAPLKLNSTTYRPNEAQQKRAVVTGHSRSRPESTLKGQVHDENAWWMGGVAGHAGLFSTIDDLMTYVRCLLNALQDYHEAQALGQTQRLAALFLKGGHGGRLMAPTLHNLGLEFRANEPAQSVAQRLGCLGHGAHQFPGLLELFRVNGYWLLWLSARSAGLWIIFGLLRVLGRGQGNQDNQAQRQSRSQAGLGHGGIRGNHRVH